jgi:D-lactate dehydrogenase
MSAAKTPLGPLIRGGNKLGRGILSKDTLPLLSPELPGGGARRRRPAPSGEPQAVYLPACVNRMFGPLRGDGVQVSFERLCALAGIVLLVPPEIESLCCGTVWSSKGIEPGHDVMREKVLPVLRRHTVNGRLPVVCDASSCSEGFAHYIESDPDASIEVIDAVEFTARHVLPLLEGYPKLDSLTLHQTCSSTQMGLNPALRTVAEAVADQVNVPLDTGCCAFAGDRGLLHPELTRAATRAEAAEVERLGASVHASCNRTCELGLTRATGKPYRHVLEYLAEQVAKGR